MLYFLMFLVVFMFASFPIGSMVFFVVSLINYIIYRVRKSRDPESVGNFVGRKKLICLIVSAVIMGVIVISEYAVLITFLNELAYM